MPTNTLAPTLAPITQLADELAAVLDLLDDVAAGRFVHPVWVRESIAVVRHALNVCEPEESAQEPAAI